MPVLINEDRTFARFLPTNQFAPGYMCQGKSSTGAGNLRQLHPAESGMRRRVLREPAMAAGKLTVDQQQIDQPGICLAAT